MMAPPYPPREVTGIPRVMLAALEQTRSATCITTADLDGPGPTIVYVNPAYCEMTGRDRDEVIGTTPRVMQGPLTDRRVLDRLRADLSAGRRFSGETVNYRKDGSPFIINWSIDPVRDEDGAITYFVATQQDVTQPVRLARRVAAEAALDDTLTRLLMKQSELRWSLQHLAEEIARHGADIAAVGLVSATVSDLDDDTSCSSGAPRAAGESRAFVFERVGSRTRVVVEVSGMSSDELAFLDVEGLGRYTERAGNVAAALLEYQRQRRTALRLQLALLPPDTPTVPDFEIATTYLPGATGMQVGGDWFDAVAVGDRLVCSVGDVAGSGADAAALMGRLRLLARVEIERGRSIGDVLLLLDEICAQDATMATVVFVELDRADSSATVWSAGHLPPIRLDRGGATSARIDVAPPLGHLRGATPTPTAITVPPGGGLLLYTDGLVERRDESIIDGIERLESSIPDHGVAGDVVDAALLSRSPDHVDDVAILALRRVE